MGHRHFSRQFVQTCMSLIMTKDNMRFPFLFRKQKQARCERKSRFQQVMDLAHDVAKIDPVGLQTLVRLVASPLQAKTITSAAYAMPHGARWADSFSCIFFQEDLPVTPDGKRAYEIFSRRSDHRFRLRLGIDPVLATPWHRDRLANALATIGFGKRQGPWREDGNHLVSLLLPMGIGIVFGGNHSMAAGIANVEGFVTSTDVQDLTPLYSYVRYDGLDFLRNHDGVQLSQPEDEEPGMLFEIGRLMVERGVAAGVEYVDPEAADAPSMSGGDGYYKVLINGQDAGIALTSSGAAMALRQAGLQEGSVEWGEALHGASPFVRSNYRGHKECIELHWSIRRRVVDDLKSVHGVMSWVAADDD